jgi:hypothetical protein
VATHDAAGTDYSSGGDVAPGLRNRPWYERADASGLPASLRQDRVKYLQALAGRADDGQDVSEWARFSAETMGVVAE